MFSNILNNLVNALTVLPGVGRKTALRMALYLMRNEDTKFKAEGLCHAITECIAKIRKCHSCQIISENDLCGICADVNRKNQLCVVENISDVINLEQTKIYQGRYFVLYGCISPIDQIGPLQLNFNQLQNLIKNKKIEELIFALPVSHSGILTRQMIIDLVGDLVTKITSLRCGLPFGGDIEYLDQNTLVYAFKERLEVNNILN